MTSPGSPSADRTPQRDQTPVEYVSRSRASSEECRPTPPRALFEDLPTAHSSITSRIAHQRSRLFPLFPYMDQPDDPDLNLQLSAGIDVPDSNLQTPSGPPNLLPSHSGEDFTSISSTSAKLSPTGGREDFTAGPENTLPNLFLENTSIDQWSKYFSRRNDSQPDHGSTRRTPSKLVKPRPPDQNPRAPVKKRSLSTSSITTNFLHRCRANLYSTPSRVEKRNRTSRETKKRYSSSSTKRNAGYRLSVSSPLERMSADVEALAAEQSASAASFAEPNTCGDIPIIAEPRPRSSVYSTIHLPTETYEQSPDTAIQTATGPYFVDPRLSTEFNCDDNDNSQQRFQSNSTSSPNFSRPVPSQFPQNIEPDGPGSSGYPNPRPSQTHPRIMSIQKPSFRTFPHTPPGHIPGSVRANTGDAGGLQSDPFFGGSDPISLDSEMEDPGPGSSQTTSSQQLSRFGTFSTLRSRFRMPSTLSSRSKDGRGKSQSFAMSPLTKDHKFPSSISGAYRNNENNAERQGNRGYGQDDVHDWETVVESQQFRSEMGREMGRDMTRMDTGSSLADYSSYGSLATAEAQPWTSLRAPSRRHRFPGPSSNPVPLHPAHQGLAHTHKLHHNPDTGSSILLPNYQYPGESFPRLDSSIMPVPALAVSTDVRPTSLVPSASRYQHPTPLDKPHPHPFQHPPPVLGDRKGKGRLQKPSLYQPPRAGPVSTTRSSKSTSLDASHRQQPPMMSGALLRPEQHKKTAMAESFGPPPSSDWYTVSSAQEMAVFSGDSYSQSQSQPHPFFSFNNTTSTSRHPQTGKRHEQPKRPFSYKYPRMSTFAAENLAAATPAANENNSHHSLPLNPHAGAPPRDCSPKSHFQEGVVLTMPERAYAPSTFSSTDRLIPDPATIPSPPRFIHRAQSQESAAKSQQQHTHIASPSAPRWPLTSNDQDSAKKRKKVPSRDDLVRERLRQLDNLIPADCNASTSNIIRRTSEVPLQRLPPSIRGTRPPCPYVLATPRSAAGIDEESSVGEWYSSTDGRYAFSSPPRLISTRDTYERIREHNTSNFIQQRRVGRELVIGSMIMVPLGWFVLGYIALWGSRSRPLIKWRSKGEVEEFHYKEIRFARKMFAFLVVFLAVTALVTATSILATR
ncbi:hypothetical protein FQN55_001288 [Onygenales sp. PD_40]|nr:hypothetical protein FQN55_001288 [Onygenales sp. PD_40]KAK2784125.1 hypothetical protein FQN52_009290 [Onygenales sp. PD_12]